MWNCVAPDESSHCHGFAATNADQRERSSESGSAWLEPVVPVTETTAGCPPAATARSRAGCSICRNIVVTSACQPLIARAPRCSFFDRGDDSPGSQSGRKGGRSVHSSRQCSAVSGSRSWNDCKIQSGQTTRMKKIDVAMSVAVRRGRRKKNRDWVVYDRPRMCAARARACGATRSWEGRSQRWRKAHR